MDKLTYKICEAVQLGLNAYYMGPKDRRVLTESEIAMAKSLLPTLPPLWYKEPQPWMLHLTVGEKEMLGVKDERN